MRERRMAREVGDELDRALEANLADKAAREAAEMETLARAELRTKGMLPMTEEELAAHKEELRKMRVVVAEKKSWEYRLSKQSAQQLAMHRQLRFVPGAGAWHAVHGCTPRLTRCA